MQLVRRNSISSSVSGGVYPLFPCMGKATVTVSSSFLAIYWKMGLCYCAHYIHIISFLIFRWFTNMTEW